METNVEATRPVRALKAHLALNVRSVERSTEFYRKMFGIEPSKVRPGYAKFDAANPPLNLTLNEAPFQGGGALSHLGIQVASAGDVELMRERWRDAGLVTRDELQTNCCYALQDKTWVRDPDGNEWEAFVVLEDNLPTTTMCCTPQATAMATTTDAATAACDTTTEAASAKATTAAAEVSSCCATAAPMTISR